MRYYDLGVKDLVKDIILNMIGYLGSLKYVHTDFGIIFQIKNCI